MLYYYWNLHVECKQQQLSGPVRPSPARPGQGLLIIGTYEKWPPKRRSWTQP